MHLFEFQLKVKKKNIIQTMLKNISTYYHPYILFIFREEEWEEVVSEWRSAVRPDALVKIYVCELVKKLSYLS